jgi:hypothetical protein
VLGKSEISNLKSQISNWPDRRSLYLLTAIVLSLAVIYKGEFWSRLIVLVFNLAVGGFILNAQYSSEQIIALLTGQTPAFLLVVGVPLLILFFGNIYCGYLCPFGAAQELVSYIVPDKLKQAVPYKTMRQARLIKYIILFIALMAYFCSRSRQTLAGDPLISAFNFHAWHISLKSAVFVIIVFALIGTVFYRRFWCRYLCPVGAFLSLFNNLIIFKRFVPIKSFIKCEFGLTAKDNMDCIYCDRCRYQLKGSRPAPAAEHPAKYLLILALIMGVFVSAFYVNKFFKAIPLPAQYSSSFTTSAGQPRDVDLQRIRTMIEEKKLSDREADFYEKKP